MSRQWRRKPSSARTPLKRRKPLKAGASLKRRPGPHNGSTLRRRPMRPLPLVPASNAQRAKVAGMECLVCGREHVDPAHIVPRKYGGCDHPDCVIPLCRAHHRAYDKYGFILERHLGVGFPVEIAHALEHAGAEAVRRGLAGGGWGPESER